MKLYQVIIAGALTVTVIIGGLLYIIPTYKVWTAEQDGKAILARAESTKKAQILDAEAKLESAKFLKLAGVEMSESLNPLYLEFLRLQMIENVAEHNQNATILDASPNQFTVNTAK